MFAGLRKLEVKDLEGHVLREYPLLRKQTNSDEYVKSFLSMCKHHWDKCDHSPACDICFYLNRTLPSTNLIEERLNKLLL